MDPHSIHRRRRPLSHSEVHGIRLAADKPHLSAKSEGFGWSPEVAEIEPASDKLTSRRRTLAWPGTP